MKRFQISNNPEGYVVEAFWPDADGMERWMPLRNFGDRQGDAIDYRDIDCPELSDTMIRALIKAYDKDRRYARSGKGRYYRVMFYEEN